MLFSRNKSKVKKQFKVVPVLAEEKSVGNTCSICGTGILSAEYIVFCPCCNLVYHAECWEENNGCGSYGCDAAPDVPKTETISEDTYVEGWVADKRCPECGAMIKSSALICKFCKSRFPNEKPMTRAQWLNRFYDGKELTSVRFTVISQFIASAFGVLSPIMLVFNVVVYANRKMLYDFRRLTPELKLLSYASLFVSTLWVVLGVLAFVLTMANITFK